MSGEAKVLTREEERDLRKWAKSAGGCGCNLRWHRLFVTLDAERARADAATEAWWKVREFRNKVAPMFCGGTDFWDAHSPEEIEDEGLRRRDATIDAMLSTIRGLRDAAEADAAALRGALDGLLDGLDSNADERCGLSQEDWDERVRMARSVADASGAGSRVAAVVEAARALRQWEAGAEERGASPRPMFDDSHEIEWDRRLDALCAAVSALDGEGARDGK